MGIFKTAYDRLKSLKIISAAEMGADDWADMPLAIREAAFFSAHVYTDTWLSSYKKSLEDFLSSDTPAGTPISGGRAKFVQDMKRRFGWGADMGAGDVRDQGSTTRLELIFTTQTRKAWGYGQWVEGSTPVMLEHFPAAKFVRTGYVQEPRPLHEEHRDEVHLKSDPFWKEMNSRDIGGFEVPYPPFGYNSQMDMIDVDRAEAELLGLLQPGDPVESPQTGYNDELKASVGDLTARERRSLISKLGSENVSIKDDEIIWKKR